MLNCIFDQRNFNKTKSINAIKYGFKLQWNVDYPNVNYPERQLSGPPLSPSRGQQKMAEFSCNLSIVKIPKKQKRTVLSIEDKLQICKKAKSRTITSLVKDNDVGKSTISDIK